MSYTERFSEVHYPLVAVVPAVYAPGAATNSTYVSLANYHRAVLVVHCGTITATGTLDIQLRQASTSAGAGVKGIPTMVFLDGDCQTVGNLGFYGFVHFYTYPPGGDRYISLQEFFTVKCFS